MPSFFSSRQWKLKSVFEFTPEHLFIECECFVELLRNPWISEAWMTSFHFNDGLYEFTR